MSRVAGQNVSTCCFDWKSQPFLNRRHLCGEPYARDEPAADADRPLAATLRVTRAEFGCSGPQFGVSFEHAHWPRTKWSFNPLFSRWQAAPFQLHWI